MCSLLIYSLKVPTIFFPGTRLLFLGQRDQDSNHTHHQQPLSALIPFFVLCSCSGASCGNNHANGDRNMQFCTDDRFSVQYQKLCLATTLFYENDRQYFTLFQIFKRKGHNFQQLSHLLLLQ
jgi:hypothetical protein